MVNPASQFIALHLVSYTMHLELVRIELSTLNCIFAG